MFIRKDKTGSSELSAVQLLPFTAMLQKGASSGTFFSRQAVLLEQQVDFCLHLVCKALDLTSAALLIADDELAGCQVYACCSKEAVRNGPFSATQGILGCLTMQDRVTLVPYRKTSPVIPYYARSAFSGVFWAARFSSGEGGGNLILCLHGRAATWTESDLVVAEKLAVQLEQTFTLHIEKLGLQLERDLLQQAFNGLRNLNTALDLDAVYAAVIRVLEANRQFAFCAVAAIENDALFFKGWSGQLTVPQLPGGIPVADSLFAQVVKYRRSFPRDCRLSAEQIPLPLRSLFKGCHSLLVLPCLQQDQDVRHLLVIASRFAEQSLAGCQDLLSLIAEQVAIKLDLARSHDKIRQMALQDSLTGIANLRAFENAFATMHERAKRRNGPLGLVVCDIDHFKKVNDTFGHPCGDLVIRTVADVLAREIRAVDLVARTGGEEFRILLEDADGASTAEVAERIRSRIAALRIPWQGQVLGVTISMGTATFQHDDMPRQDLIGYADQALYRAKRGGRDRVCHWKG